MAFRHGKMTPMSRPHHRCLLLVAAVTTSILGGSESLARADETPPIAAADLLWQRRGEGHRGARAAAEPIGAAIEAYERLVAGDPTDLEARWKLLRALHFRGEYVLEDPAEKLALFDSGRDLAEESRGLLLERLDLDPGERDPQTVADAAAAAPESAWIYFYAAIHWGLWGENTGKMKAARQGLADKLRDFAETVILIDRRLANAGGLRFLGRLHTEAPRIPFVTGWIDRDQAVEYLGQACELAPNHPANQLFLADALLRFRDDRRAEAIRRLETVVSTPPRANALVEDLATLADARTLLADHQDPP